MLISSSERQLLAGAYRFEKEDPRLSDIIVVYTSMTFFWHKNIKSVERNEE